MSEQEMRDALEAAVAEPPPSPGRGAAARGRAGTMRRQRITVAAAVVLVVAAASAGLWAIRQPDPGPTVTGSGAPACRQLAREVHAGRVDDSQVVDGGTVATWLAGLSTDVDPSRYRDEPRVTVCLTAARVAYATYIIGQGGAFDRVTQGGFNGKHGALATMRALDALRTDGRATSDAPFSCPAASTPQDLGVSSTLPSGAVAARLCSDGDFYTPSLALTSGVDELIRDINDARLGYTPPNFNCSPYAGAYDYTMVFRYPAGTRTVTYDPCRGMELGQFTRGVPLTLDQTFLSLLAQQVGSASGPVTPPPCPGSRSDGPEGVGDLRHVVAGRFCPASAGGNAALSPPQLGLLHRWGRSLNAGESVPENSCPVPPSGWPRLTLADAWGSTFTLVLEGCGRRVYPSVVNPGDHGRVSHPDGSRQALLRLVRQLAVG